MNTKKVNQQDLNKFNVTGFEPMQTTDGLYTNPNVPTHHADIVNIIFTTDGSAKICFFSRTPGVNVEECRVSFSHALAKKIVDLLCLQLNYYPEKPAQQNKTKD